MGCDTRIVLTPLLRRGGCGLLADRSQQIQHARHRLRTETMAAAKAQELNVEPAALEEVPQLLRVAVGQDLAVARFSGETATAGRCVVFACRTGA